MANGKDRDGQQEATWRTIIGKFSRSGLTIRDENKLHESAFYFWRRQLQQRQEQEHGKHGKHGKRLAAPRFVAVRVESQEPAVASGGMQTWNAWMREGPCLGSHARAIVLI